MNNKKCFLFIIIAMLLTLVSCGVLESTTTVTNNNDTTTIGDVTTTKDSNTTTKDSVTTTIDGNTTTIGDVTTTITNNDDITTTIEEDELDEDAPVYLGMKIIDNEMLSNTSEISYTSSAKLLYSRIDSASFSSIKPKNESSFDSTLSMFPLFDNHRYIFPPKIINHRIDELVDIDVVVDDEVKNFAKKSETFILQVLISNPKKYEIQSFTLNGEKYVNYMFRVGSTVELLLLELNAPSESGYYDYSIDAIKYIDDTVIKNVDMSKAEKTIKVGVSHSTPPTAIVEHMNVLPTSISFDVYAFDQENLIKNNNFKVYLSDGDNIISEKQLSVGVNSVTFDNLYSDRIYECGIAVEYDFIDERYNHIEWIYKEDLETPKVFDFSNVTINNDSITYSIDKRGNNGEIKTFSLYDASTNEFVKDSDENNTTSFDELLSDHDYKLYVDYEYNVGQNKVEDWALLEFKTLKKNEPLLSFDSSNLSVFRDTISYQYTLVDDDDVVSKKEVVLYDLDGNVIQTQPASISGVFENLNDNSNYRLVVNVVYDLNDGSGQKTLTMEENAFIGSISFEYTLDPNNKVKITKYVGNESEVILPLELDNYPVYMVAKDTFINRDYVTSIVIQDPEITYEWGCFKGLSGIKSITIPNNVQISLLNLFDVSKESDLPNTLDTIVLNGFSSWNTTFFKNTSSKLFIIKQINCNQVASFKNNTQIKGFIIGDSVNAIQFDAFNGCSSIETIIVDENNTKYDSRNDCNAIIETNTNKLIFGCKNTVIPDSVVSIEEKAFYGIPLVCISIPASVKSIYENAFNGNELLELLFYSGNKTQWDEMTADPSFTDVLSNVTVFYNSEVKSLSLIETPSYSYYKDNNSNNVYVFKTLGDKEFESFNFEEKLPGLSIITLGRNAFSDCFRLKTISLPNTITLIGNQAFTGCSSLVSINIPSVVETLGETAFSKCSSLMYIVLPNSLTSIGGGCFSNCGKLKYIFYNGSNEEYSSIKKGLLPFPINTTLVYEYNSEVTNLSYVEERNYSYYLSNNDRVYEFKMSTTSVGSFVFENELSDKIVVSLASDAFKNNTRITSINIPTSVKFIGSGAFNGCSSLSSIIIPEGVKTIEDNTFNSCMSLSRVTLPSSITKIGSAAFYNTALSYISIPNGVKTISRSAFAYCSELSLITLPKTLTSVANEAFNGCYSITNVFFSGTNEEWNSITISSNNDYILDADIEFESNVNTFSYVNNSRFSYTLANDKVFNFKTNEKNMTIFNFDNELSGLTIVSFGPYAFSGCENLLSITIPDTVTKIGEYAFYECHSLRMVSMPNNLKSIEMFAFSGCWDLKNITIPDSVISIGDGAFYSCYSLSSIIIPQGIEKIEASTFNYCNELSVVSIPTSVQKIMDFAFYECNRLNNVFYGGSDTDWLSIDIGTYNEKINKTHIDYNCIVTSIETVENENYSYILVNNQKVLNFVFNNRAIELESFDFAEELPGLTVVSIGICAFSGFSSLKSITIPNTVTTIGEQAFACCSELRSIAIPNSVTSIGPSAFSECQSLTSIVIPDSVATIEEYTFANCSNLVSIIIPNSVTSIGNGAFSGCSLSAIVIPNSVILIGESAFEYCQSLINCFYSGSKSKWNSITIEQGNECLLNASIEYSSNLTFRTIQNDKYSYLLSSDNRVFGFKNIDKTIESFNFEEELPGLTIVSLANRAFCECTSLKSIVIPSTITKIDNETFCYCTSLSTITIPNGVTSIGLYAFAYCSSLTSITISDTVKFIGYDAFYGCSNLTFVLIGSNFSSIEGGIFGACNKLTKVYFNGNESRWNSIEGISDISEQTIYFYSGTEPTVVGNFWHYVYGAVTEW